MFPLKPRDELVFGTSTNNIISTPSHGLFDARGPISHNIFLNDPNLMVDQATSRLLNFTTTTTTTTTTISFSSNTTGKPGNRTAGGNEIEMKRALHRNLERQRRQEMSQLYASLRSILPLDHIKGKHSLSDLMHESRDYIKELQNNVQELRVQRDKMKKLERSSTAKISNSNGTRGNLPNQVEVNKLGQDGVEILITCSSEFGISSAMNELMMSELSVVSSMSTKINERVLHIIQAEASDSRLVDLSRLQERLTDLIN